MANLAKIQLIAEGQFFVKDSLGNLVELRVGDNVSLNDTIVASNSNSDLSKIEILFDTNELIVLSQGEQLLDITLLASTFGDEELAFEKKEIDETLNAWNNVDGDVTDIETAAGDPTQQETQAGQGDAKDGGALRSKFSSRDGDATDVISDLRDASWGDGIEGTIEDSENMLLQQPLPVVYTIIEGLGVVNEGDSANYVVKLVDAAGNPVIATQDTIIYVRYTNKTTQNGDTEYNHNKVIEVVIKAGTSQTEFIIKTVDDYLADNGEIYNVAITGNNSTAYDMRNGDVNGNKTNVDTTILDNTTTNPNGDSNVESDMEKVVLKIVAADENGNPIKGANGDYLTQNEVPEGNNAYYVVLAFEPNTTKFNDSTKVDVQGGTVEVQTFDKNATGTTTQTKEDGTQDYISKTEKVELGKVISVKTLDDWKADNNEQYEIKITDKSYEHPKTGALYENVVTDENPVTTTIKDNTTTTPNEDSTTETNGMEKVILKIVAVDKDGKPLFEADGKTYKTTSDVVEGDSAYYKVFAFAPDSNKVFNTDTKLPDNLQGGTVTVKTGNIGAIGVPAETLNDGSQDYISNTQTDVKVGETIFTVKTIDDYKAEIEADETFKVEIEVGSYKHPNNDIKDAIYENITVDSTVVTTTIVDNNATKNADVVTGGTDTNSTTYGAEDTVYAIITADKSSVNEGEIVTYTVKLVDYKGNEVKVSNPTDVTIKFEGTGLNKADLEDLLKINGIEVTNTTKDTFTIQIPKDESSIDFKIETKDDVYAEGKESYSLKIADIDTKEFENIKFNNYTGLTNVNNPSNTTTTEINDNGTEVKIVLVAVTSPNATVADITYANGKLIDTNTNTTPESGKLYYIAVAVDKDNNVLIQDGKVKVSTYDVENGAKGGNSIKPPLDGSEDYQSLKGKEVSLGKVFEVQTNDDYMSDNNEKFEVKIDSIVDGSKYEEPVIDTTRNTVTSTITDNAPVKNQIVVPGGEDIGGNTYGQEDTVWAVISADKSSVVEGNEVTYTVKLVDYKGNEVKVSKPTDITIKFAGEGLNQASLDDLLKINGVNVESSTTDSFTIKIPTNSSNTKFTIQTKDDFIAEGDEKYTLSISDINSSEFENLVYDRVKDGAEGSNKTTTTIKDGVTLGDPKNAYVDEDKFYENRLDGTKGENIKKANIDDTKSLGIIKNGETDFKLSFESNSSSNPIVTVQKGRPEEGVNPSTLSEFKYKDGSTTLKSDGNEIKYKLVGTDKIVGYTGLESAYNKNKVFEITLEKNNEGKYSGDYKYTQFKNIDHPIDGGDKNINDDDITFEFGFKITDQGSTSDVQKFKVTVNDSTPLAGDNTLIIYEDNDGKQKGAYTFVLSDEGFQKDPKDPSTKGQIEIDNNDGKGYQTVAKDGIVSIYDGNEVVGTLKNNGNGTLTFEPVADYSKYTDDNLPNFKYKVYDTDGDYATGKIEIKVKPVADAPTIFVKDVETTEDYNNTQEGTNKVALGLKTPLLSKDSQAIKTGIPSDYTSNNKDKINPTTGYNDSTTPDKNSNATGDHPERNGEITLKFTNGGSLVEKAEGNPIKNTGAKLFYIKDGENKPTEIENFLINSNKNLKVVIVETSGGKSIDKTYHYEGLVPTAAKNGKVIYLTQKEYESLQIQHAEDNDTDIKITIKVTSYEVNDNGEKLYKNNSYSDKDDSKLYKETSADMIVKIKAVTDDISLEWDKNKATEISKVGELKSGVLVFNSIKENNSNPKGNEIQIENELDFGKLLTPTSGAGKDTKLDLDGSEQRSYTINLSAKNGTTLPDSIKITIGNTTQEVFKDKDGNYKLDFGSTNNQLNNPDFKIKFPDGWSGGVDGTITLRTKDFGVDNDADTTDYTSTGGETDGVKKAEVKFEVNITPVANEATLKVGQVIGYEDAGRTSNNENGKYDKNIQDKDGAIKHPENGIALDIKVTSTDKDGSETFTVTIKDIPNGGAIFVKEPIAGKDILVTYSEDGTPTIKVWNNGVLEDYTGTVIKADKGSITVEKYDNENPPKFIPPHNEHGDFTLKVDAITVDKVEIDGVIVEDKQPVATAKEITVIVKDVADSVVGNDYNQETLVATPNTKDEVIGTHQKYNAIVNEDTKIELKSIFTDYTKLASYDSSSEDLTIIIKEKDLNGGTLEGKDVNYVNGQYIFKATDIDGITIKTPANYSGELKFDITYITTERGDDNGKPSKTFDSKTTTDSVSIFVKPTVDAGFISNTTKLEDGGDIKQDGVEVKDGLSYYKLDLGISHKNGDDDETLEEVVIYESDKYTLFIKDENGDLKPLPYSKGEANLKGLGSIYVQAKEHENGEVEINGKYTVRDSHYGSTNSNYVATKTENFTHKLTITPVTDKPELKIESINDLNSQVNGTKVLIKDITASFTVNTKTTSVDTDGSEKVVKIVISGVPEGVTINSLLKLDEAKTETDYKEISFYKHNGVYVIELGKDIDVNGVLESLTFNISGGDFIDRDITITTYTEDSGNGDIKQDSKTINIVKDYGTGGGTGQGIVLETKPYVDAVEDTKFSLLNIFNVSGGQQTGDITIKVANGTIEGYTPDANGVYTIHLKGNAADIGTILSQIKVIPNPDFNDNQGEMQLTVSGFGLVDKIVDVAVTPVTDELTVKIEATATDSINGIVENKPVELKITLTNSVDGKYTEPINSITIKVSEDWNDKNVVGENTNKGLLSGANYNIVPNGDGTTFTITKQDGKSFDFGEIKGLQYTPTTNRNGNVSFEVIVNNKEINATDGGKSATNTADIIVKPTVSSIITFGEAKAGLEDKEMASVQLVVAEATKDKSETFESVIIKVATGVAVYYNDGKSLAMNAGEDGKDTIWIVPVNQDGSLPQVFFKGKEDLAGKINFTATINAKDGNEKVSITLENGEVYIKEVADGVTIDPTKTGTEGKIFDWTTLNLNANMKDVDGSEKMYFTLEGLSSSAQFRIVDKDGNITDLSSQAKFENGKWSIEGVDYKDINNIQLTHDKSVKDVEVKAWTVETDKDGNPIKDEGGNVIKTNPTADSSGKFDLSFTKDAVVDGKLTLGKEIDIDFSKITNGDIKDVSTIDLGASNGKNELLNLTLEDVLAIGKKDGGNINLTILGDGEDKVTFKDSIVNGVKNEWSSKDITEDGKSYTEWSNSGDESLKIKVEQPISDGITN